MCDNAKESFKLSISNFLQNKKIHIFSTMSIIGNWVIPFRVANGTCEYTFIE
jgi:hypothetical protein